MKVVFFQRKPFDNNYSVEGLFQAIRGAMPDGVECEVAISKYISSGIYKRIYNFIEASFRQGDINHIAGDVHYISYLLCKKKTILTVLDCVFTQHESRISRKLVRLLWYVIPEKRVAKISVISQATKDELLKVVRCDPGKIIVIHACISARYVFIEKEFNSSKPLILQVGTGNNKNLIRLFEALKGVTCRLDLIGKLTPEHKKLLSDYQIEYINSSNISEAEMINKYKECDLVTFISTYEGFGMPILEANAVGRPVITGNIYSMPEVAGDAACMVDPFSVSAIKDGITRIIEDKDYRTILINNGRKNVERFKPEHIAKCYRDIYVEMLK
ncbi:MAG: glycosyltransferase family 1 protein [Syntrophales bacterium]|nr:glycosyltransferase family 1 protein [Syntrophales bacterium]